MQLVAYGAQDIYLTGNPQITFFKVVYRRHTNFAMEVIEQTLSGANTAAGGSGTCTVSRNGDLVSGIHIASSTVNIHHGDELVKDVELEIDCDYELNYINIIDAITAVSGRLEDGQLIEMVKKISFVPLER